MAVYNDVEGGKTCFGEVENFHCFGNFDVNITVPAKITLWKQQVIMNRSEVFTAQVKDTNWF
jgi:hypothetical protein